MGTAHRSQREEDRQRAECCTGSRGCSLQRPQPKQERPRADKDTKRLRACVICRTGIPLETSACAGICGQRYCREGSVGGEACACSLAPLLFAVN